jgi:hypothetical protein
MLLAHAPHLPVCVRVCVCVCVCVCRLGAQATVDEILADTNGCYGVRLVDGTELHARRVVSSVGVETTYALLTPGVAVFPQALVGRASKGFVMVNAGLRGNAEALGITCVNEWVHPCASDGDINGPLRAFMAAPLSPETCPPIMITFP